MNKLIRYVEIDNDVLLVLERSYKKCNEAIEEDSQKLFEAIRFKDELDHLKDLLSNLRKAENDPNVSITKDDENAKSFEVILIAKENLEKLLNKDFQTCLNLGVTPGPWRYGIDDEMYINIFEIVTSNIANFYVNIQEDFF